MGEGFACGLCCLPRRFGEGRRRARRRKTKDKFFLDKNCRIFRRVLLYLCVFVFACLRHAFLMRWRSLPCRLGTVFNDFPVHGMLFSCETKGFHGGKQRFGFLFEIIGFLPPTHISDAYLWFFCLFIFLTRTSPTFLSLFLVTVVVILFFSESLFCGVGRRVGEGGRSPCVFSKRVGLVGVARTAGSQTEEDRRRGGTPSMAAGQDWF